MVKFLKVIVLSYIKLRLIIFFCFFTRRIYTSMVKSKAPIIRKTTRLTVNDAPTSAPVFSPLVLGGVVGFEVVLVVTAMTGFSTTSVL